MAEIKKYHYIPIYGHHLELVVCDDISESRNSKKRLKYLNEYKCLGVGALCSSIGSVTEIFLKKDKVTHRDVAHEIFHATSFIMDYAGCKHDASTEESFAYLVGFITDKVYKDLKKWKIKIK